MGLPNSQVEVIESASAIATSSGGTSLFALVIPTARGDFDRAYPVFDERSFTTLLGPPIDDDPQAAMAYILAKNRVKMLVVPAAHFTDVDDISTAEGTKATGTITDSTNTVTFTATRVGPGYHDLVQIRQAVSGAVDKIDILFTRQDVAGSSADVYLDFPATGSVQADWDKVEAKFGYVTITAATGDLYALATASGASVTLSGGVFDATAIVAADYAGSVLAGNGLYGISASEFFPSVKYYVPLKQDLATLQAFAQHAAPDNDKEVFAGHPNGLTPVGVSDYCLAANAYVAGPDVSSTFVVMWLSSLIYSDPRTTGAELTVPGHIGAVICTSRRDNNNALRYQNPASEDFWKVDDTRGFLRMGLDMGAVTNRTYLDLIRATKGVNVVTKHRLDGVVIDGDYTFTKDQSSSLSIWTIRHVTNEIVRKIPPLFEQKTKGKPNAPSTWLATATAIRTLVQDDLVAGGAIRPNEGTDWIWIGDQDVQDYLDVLYNTVSGIDAGEYRAAFVFKGIPSARDIVLGIIPTDTQGFNTIVSQVNA